ncbi:hypothetical protein [Frankia sp. Cas3]|uniref:hypothetical protein n=1 Tax=Frankia sp. Cas3 TaxID=3073926 RepID=UPI002AD57312|nr:hypothetical protein [Frankia sp. Cas3]
MTEALAGRRVSALVGPAPRMLMRQPATRVNDQAQNVMPSARDAPVVSRTDDDSATDLFPEALLLPLLDEIPNFSVLLRLGPLKAATGPSWLQGNQQSGLGKEPVARPGTGGDLRDAIARIPGVDVVLDSAKAALLRDWRRLSSDQKAFVVVNGIAIFAPILADEDIRSALDGAVVPKPQLGSPWLDNIDIVLHTRGGGLGVGLQVDIAGLLRSKDAGGVLSRSLAGGPGPPRSSADPMRESPVSPAGTLPVVVPAGSGTVPRHEPLAALAQLDRLARADTPRKVPMPEGMMGKQAWEITASAEQAFHLADLADTTLSGSQVIPSVESVTIIYTNDGRGPFPNIGGGADQELTVSAHVRVNFVNTGRGWVSGGYNLEIWTPLKGGPPKRLLGYGPGLYPGQPGPGTGGYKGLVYADFDYRIAGNGTRNITLLTRLGVNSTWLGEEIQSNWVHRSLGIALFDWKQEPTEPYASLGLRARTMLDLIEDRSLSDAEFRLRLTLSSQAVGGTHDTEVGGTATLSVRSGFVHLVGPMRAAFEFRIGADGRGIVRYNDQGGVRAGVEAGVSTEVGIHLRDVNLPWLPVFDATLFAGSRSQQSTLPEGRAPAGEDRPGVTGAWLGPGSKTQGRIGVEIPLR